MSVFSDVYTQLNVAAIANLVDDISPYVRARNTSFPAIVFTINDEEFERDSSGSYRSLADVEVQCMARTVAEAETVATAVRNVVEASACDYLTSITRDYEEGYDDDSVGLFLVTVNYTKPIGA